MKYCHFTVFCILSVLLVCGSAVADDIEIDAFYAFAFENNDIWISTNAGIVLWNENDGVKQLLTERDGLVGIPVRSIAVDRDGVKWFGTEKGLSRYDGRTWTTYTEENVLISDWVSCLAVDLDNVLWVGTERGLSSYNGFEWTKYTTIDDKPIYRINNIVIDSTNSLWITTSKGVGHYHEGEWTLYDESNGIETNAFKALAVDADNRPWISCYSIAKGSAYYDYLQHFDGTEFKTIKTDRYFTSSPFETLFIDKDDVNKGIWYDRSKALVYYHGEDISWYPAQNETWYPYPLPDEAVLGWGITAMERDSNGLMWMITAGRGCDLYSFDGAEFTRHDIVIEGVGVEEMPKELAMIGNHPNPFNPVTWITFMLSSAEHVRLTVYDVTGATVETLIDSYLPAGTHEKVYDGSGMASGVYFYRLEEHGGAVRSGKMLLVK